MPTCIYPTPEWLEESKKLYDSTFEKKLKKYAYPFGTGDCSDTLILCHDL